MSPRHLLPHVPSRVFAFELLDSRSYSWFFLLAIHLLKALTTPHPPQSICSLLKGAGRKLHRPTLHYEYQQQQYIFKSGAGPGLFYVMEVNTHHNSQMAKWLFPFFYRSHLGCLIYRWALYIKMWELQKSPAITSLPNLSMILKHLHHLTSFTDWVVKACLTEASQHNVVPTWVPKTLQEWLILGFHCGHGYNASAWLDANKDEVPMMEPSKFS